MVDTRRNQPWRPGSFTKNYSWGPKSDGLKRLHESIRIGFADELIDVTREIFRNRVAIARRPEYIPINFFLYNKIVDGVDTIIVDELVFQALTEEHSARFDKLALTTFNLSDVGVWRGADEYQRYPALWSHYYVRERLSRQLDWRVKAVTANDIEQFVASDKRYTAQTARKLATNLNYLYGNGRLDELATPKIDRWWVDALFVALDRAIETARINGRAVEFQDYESLLEDISFAEISGPWSTEKSLAVRHLISLYQACGGRDRFSDDLVKQRTLSIPDVAWLLANDPRPGGAIHPSNPAILKSIPRSCAMLAVYAGFEVLDPDEMANFDPVAWVKRHTRAAITSLKNRGVKPTMSADELMKITRDR